MHTRARVHDVIQLARLTEPSHLMEGKDRSVATHIYTHTSAGEEPLTFNGIMSFITR